MFDYCIKSTNEIINTKRIGRLTQKVQNAVFVTIVSSFLLELSVCLCQRDHHLREGK